MELKSIVEALLFSSQKPVSAKELRQVFLTTGDLLAEDDDVQEHKGVKPNEITKVLEALAKEYEEARRSFRLVQIAGAWQLVAQPDYAPWIRTLVGEKQRPSRLSAPALETLAIIAYRQPITRSGIEQIRGVSIDGTMQKLQERGLVEQVGKAEVVGRPSLYGTTTEFLEYFGIGSLEDLPAAEDLRSVQLKDEPLATAEPGLATAPPEQLTLEEAAHPKENTAAEVVSEDDEFEDDDEFDEEDEEEDEEQLDDDGEAVVEIVDAGEDEEDEFDDEEDEFDEEDEEDDEDE